MSLIRRALMLAVLAYVIASCGLDVIGVEPSPRACVFDDDASTFESPCFFAQ